MKHDLYKTGDKDVPWEIQDQNGEVVLGLCKVCGGAEGTLPTECPGVRMKPQQYDDVQGGMLDFRDGSWKVAT